jgi:hypothetical protein
VTPHAASLRSSSQSVRNPTTWFQLGLIGDAGPEIRNGLGVFYYAARFAEEISRSKLLFTLGQRYRCKMAFQCWVFF